MMMPPIQGTCTQSSFFIYAACDSKYFEEFGYEFIRSIQQNTNAGIHIHVFNPTQEQIEFCNQPGVSITWETITPDMFAESASRFASEPFQEPERDRYRRTQNAMVKGHDCNLHERMQKTYYACARFIRLAEILPQGQTCLAIDIDAIVRKSITPLPDKYDFYIHRITGRKARFLAGGIHCNPNAGTFLKQYAEQLKSWINRDYLYWGLDQDLLDPIVPLYRFGQLPMSYIDWNMDPSSIIWTAKGARKESEVFVNEKQQYTHA